MRLPLPGQGSWDLGLEAEPNYAAGPLDEWFIDNDAKDLFHQAAEAIAPSLRDSPIRGRLEARLLAMVAARQRRAPNLASSR